MGSRTSWWFVILAAASICLSAHHAAALPAGSNPVPLPTKIIPVASSQSIGLEIKRALGEQTAGNLAGAEQWARQALADAYKLRSRRDFMVSFAQSVLGSILRDQGKFEEAERTLKDALSLSEAKSGLGNPDSISPLQGLGILYLRQGRLPEAAGSFDQAVKIAQKNYGANSLDVAELMNALGATLHRMARTSEAEATLRQVIAIGQQNGQKGLDVVADASNNLGEVLAQMGRSDDAIAAYHAAYDANVALYGPDNPAPILNLMNGGLTYRDLGDYDNANKMLTTVLNFRERVLGPDHPDTALVENNLGWLELARKAPQAAAAYFRKSVSAYLHVRALQIRGIRGQGAGVEEREVNRSILGLLKSLAALQSQDPDHADAVLDEAFQATQGIHLNQAAESLVRAGARLASGDAGLADIVRQGQDMAAQWQGIDAVLTKAIAQPAGQRNPGLEQQARAKLSEINSQIDGIDAQIAQRFPAYSNLTHPQPISVPEVQGLLEADEALVLISTFGANNGNGTFVWVITKQDAKWVSSDTSVEALGKLVWTLRCGVDTEASASDDCKSQIGEAGADGLPKFSAKASYDLYHVLFGGLESTIAGKSLLIVAPDPLASLPFQILATQPPAQDFPHSQAELRGVAWLGRESPISVLPSVTALRVSRGQKQRDHAPDVYVGIGDPALAGNRDCPETDAVTDCPDTSAVASLQPALVKRSVGDISKLFKNGNVDVDAVRALCPLPDTATELRCVASSIGAPPSSVHIGEDATKPAIKKLDLEQYRIIHFATHGLVAGQLASGGGTLGEPALVLTPPAAASADDDGLLKESDVVNLRLNADWVVLSACNTAAGKQSGGEALSGLASAFLYAGARALLASHWSVSSDSAVRLTTAAMLELAKDPTLGRAEAMRRSMINVLDHGGEFDAHPLIWAPFSVIGEGGKGHS